MSAYFDASALAAILFRDSGWRSIAGWLGKQDDKTVYSDFGLGEVCSAVGNRVRRKDLSPDEGLELIAEAAIYLQRWQRIDITRADIADATRFLATFSLALRLPDALHLAAARRLGIVLVSTDAGQVRAAQALGIAFINPVSVDGNPS